jgi:LPS export ABC transporter protein LptC
MRNSEAQRYARWSAMGAALVALLVAGVYLRNLWIAKQAARKAPPAVPPSIEQQSNEFSFSKVEGQRTIYTIRASRTTAFKEGSRNLLEDVDIVVYGKKAERSDSLRTRACDFISDTGKISCLGEVQIQLQANKGGAVSPSAIQVATSGITFDRDSGVARTDKPVTFRWPAGEGRAVGVLYDSDTGTLNLTSDVDLDLSPATAEKSALPQSGAPPAPPAPERNLHLTGDHLAFHRDSRLAELHGNVHAQQPMQDFSAENLLLVLDEDFHARRLEASGHPQVHQEAPQGTIAMNADTFTATMRQDGSVDSVEASGTVHGTRETPAGRDEITAARIRLDLATRLNVPRLLSALGGVSLFFTSADPKGGTRRVETDALEIHFSDQSQPRATAIDYVNTLAPARAELRNSALLNGKPAEQLMRIYGTEMNLKFGPDNRVRQLTGSGGVEVNRKVGDAPEQTITSKDLAARFSDSGDWSSVDQTGDVRFRDDLRSGQADHAHAEHSANAVTLDGSVSFSDAATRTTARSVTFSQNSKTLRADGNVLTTELSAGAGGVSNFAPAPAHISASQLVANTSTGHATYTGGGRLWQGQSVIQADTIDLDSPTHTLIATGHVHGVFPESAWSPKGAPALAASPSATPIPKPSANAHAAKPGETQLGRVQGGKLTYWESESKARIEQDAQAISQQAAIHADQIDLFFSSPDSASGTKQLTRALATGEVAVSEEDRRGTSSRAEYTASEGKFVLSEGNPTLYSSTGDTTTGRQLTFFFADDRIVVDSAEGSKTVTLHRVEK